MVVVEDNIYGRNDSEVQNQPPISFQVENPNPPPLLQSNPTNRLPPIGNTSNLPRANIDELREKQMSAIVSLKAQTQHSHLNPSQTENLLTTIPLTKEAQKIALPNFAEQKHKDLQKTMKYGVL